MRRQRLAASVLLALVPAIVFVVADAFVAWGAGRVSAFPSVEAYRLALNAAVLLRYWALFIAVIAVWALVRRRNPPAWVLLLAILSGPLAYALTEFVRVQAFFPVGQAAYYMLNPLFVGAVGSQVGWAAVAEVLWRWWGRRRGADRGPILTWRIGLALGLGGATLFASVLWDGGVHWFYVYQQGYKVLFSGR